MSKIYWAGNMFTAAAREWNATCAEQLRDAGHDVLLPQELPDNRPGHSPSPIDIFVADTGAILDSDVVVGVLDDETIDSGVAAELALAHAVGKDIIGLYTDIRQHRPLNGMYKNLYVVGLLECSLGIYSSVDDLNRRLRQASVANTNALSSLPPSIFDSFVSSLEAAYVPHWTSCGESIALLNRSSATSVIDFGCGTGRLAAELNAQGSTIRYLGFDIDTARIVHARQRLLPRQHYEFFSSERELLDAVSTIGDMQTAVLCSFVLHDVPDLSTLIRLLQAPTVRHLIALDLTRDDLPGLASLLSKAIGRPPVPSADTRMSIGRIHTITRQLGVSIVDLQPVSLTVSFDRPDAVLTYCEMFGLFTGADMPFAPRIPAEAFQRQFHTVLERLEFPWRDSRHFVRIVGEVAAK